MAKPKPDSLGQLIDRLDGLREKYRKAETEAKTIKTAYDELAEEIQNRLHAENMDKATGKRATVSLKKSIVATITDWDALTRFIKKKGYYHLFNRSVNTAAFRELYDMEVLSKTEPLNPAKYEKLEEKFAQATGLRPFTKITLNHSSLKTAA
jgi:RecJ-like exonuclease